MHLHAALRVQAVSACVWCQLLAVFQRRLSLHRVEQAGLPGAGGSPQVVFVLCRWFLCHCSLCRNVLHWANFKLKNIVWMFQGIGKGTHDFLCLTMYCFSWRSSLCHPDTAFPQSRQAGGDTITVIPGSPMGLRSFQKEDRAEQGRNWEVYDFLLPEQQSTSMCSL